MIIAKAEIENFRALKSISAPLDKLSILLGENDAGKTSFLHALNAFFGGKKLNEETDWFKHDPTNPVIVTLTLIGISAAALGDLARQDGSLVARKIFTFDKAPVVKAIMDDGVAKDIPKSFQEEWLSSDRFHFIPVRRDLAVQFSMNKTSLLGKTLRKSMSTKLKDEEAIKSLENLKGIIEASLDEPREKLERLLQEQMHNDRVRLGFAVLQSIL